MFLQGLILAGLSSVRSVFLHPHHETHQSKQKSYFQYALNNDEKKQLKHSKDKPKIVALYDKNDGSGNADLAILHLEGNGLHVVKVPSDEGLNHSVFTNNRINGIYLPGGSDIPINDDNDPRKKFEGQLTQLARERDIPLLGICRGEQAVGYHNGLAVKDLSDYNRHYDHDDANNSANPNLNNTVVVKNGSQLYAALQHKLKSTSGNDPIEYDVTCLHHQHLEANPNNHNLEVTGCNKFDNTIESIERRTGKYCTVGLQHHPEVVISSCEEARKEKLIRGKKEADKAQLLANFFDSEVAVFTEYKNAQKMKEANTKSKDERAARAEFGFFIKQAKKSFLESASQPARTPSPRPSSPFFPIFSKSPYIPLDLKHPNNQR